MTTPVDVRGCIAAVRDWFGFLRELDENELRWARCRRGEEWEARQAINALVRADGRCLAAYVGVLWQYVVSEHQEE